MKFGKRMRHHVSSILSIILALIVFSLFQSRFHAQTTCSETSLPELPDVTITSVTQETEYAAHCKVSGVIGKEIKFELHLPEDWNGKFVFGGGGGFAGEVINLALSYGALQKGYATVGTDTGHEGHALDASWANNNMERLVNFGHLAVHRTAVTAKSLIESYYNQKITQSYFVGCSRGGGQALMEAQRYPDDFDGIVAGAPAYNWTNGLGAVGAQIMQAMYPDPNDIDEALLNRDDLKLIEATYLAQCDDLDGIKDGILNDPRKCDFDIETLLCNGEKTKGCLTQAQIEAAKIIYEGPNDKNGALYYGFPLGGETDPGGWFRWFTGGLKYAEALSEFQNGVDVSTEFEEPITPNTHYAFSNGVMQHFIYHDSTWTYKDYDFDDFREDAKLVGNTLNAVSPDLSKFRENGGKLLMFTGWSDMAISAYGTIGYYESVISHDESAIDDVKLFMMPGVMHCAGGIGPHVVNWLDEIDNWVGKKSTPDQITAYFLDENNQVDGSRPICPYPSVAIYDGKGDTRDVRSFTCGDSE